MAQGPFDNRGLYLVNFNQDNTSLAVGTLSGYRLFSLNNPDNKLEQIFESDPQDVNIVERLFSSSLVALVASSSPRKLRVCHFKKGTEICNYTYSNSILAVKLNRSRLIVCLEDSLFIHNIKDMTILHNIKDTPKNIGGFCALTPTNGDNCYLAYPGSATSGEVQVFDAENLTGKLMIPAHNNPLAAMSFNPTGTRIATASNKGTVIRVFSVLDGTKLYEFRRGVKRTATIFSLGFSHDSAFLCASSSTETVHVFKLEEPRDTPQEESQGWMEFVGRAIISTANFLPTPVSEMMQQGRSFATIKLPFSGIRNICCIVHIKGTMKVIVVSSEGYLYIYNLDVNHGGDCVLDKQHRLDGKPDLVSPPPPEEVSSTPTAAVPSPQPVPTPTSPPPAVISYASTVRSPQVPTGSYAEAAGGRIKGALLTEAERLHEIASATAETVGGGFKLNDDDEFPPMTALKAKRVR